jgi:ADP-ribose pyrophosphatase YjhB (NUDIX family)
MIEHHIQTDILLKLAKAERLRFSELKPKGMESNLFMYHLHQLQARKMVEKDSGAYRLSNDGLSYIDGFSFNTLKPRKAPKIICILAIRSPSGQWLLARRKYQPYIGRHMFVSGKRHLGESPEAHAHRELHEKLNFDLALTQRGLADVRIYRGQDLITHVTAHVYTGQTGDDELPPPTHQFDYVWFDPKQDVPLLAGTREIMDKIETDGGNFLLSLDVSDD